MHPTVSFENKEKKDPLKSQIPNLSSKWNSVEDQVFNQIYYYANHQWKIESIRVKCEQMTQRGSSYLCEGEVLSDKPDVVYLYLGKKVNGGGTKIMLVLIHELIHSLIMSNPDYRFKKPGKLEDLIFDELATDLLAQHVLHKVFNIKIKTMDSVYYALDTVADRVVNNREHKEDRDNISKRLNKTVQLYLKTNKNYFSFRKELMKI